MAKSIIDAMADPLLFGPWFFPESNWRPWRTVVKAIFGLKLDAWERRFFRDLYGDRTVPTEQAAEALILAGRGAGKSLIAALITSYMAALRDWSHLKRRVRVVCMACDREQAEEVLAFVNQFFSESPILAGLVAERTKSSITLKSGVKISIRTASARGIRGPSIACAVADELPAWPSEPSANSDMKVLRALRPALGKVPGSLLVSIDSTGDRTGSAFELYSKHYGHDDAPVLVAKATSRQLNITPDHRREVERQFRLDEYSARAEYDSEWMSDAASFISRDRITVIEAVNPSPPALGRLFTGLDANGGSLAGDAFTMATAWVTAEGRIGVGLLESRAGRTDPTTVVQEFASVLHPYRNRVTIAGDRYAAGCVPAAFRKHGLALHGPHRRPKTSGGGTMSASDYYLGLLGRLGRTDFPDHPRLLGELFGLVRTPDGVDHPSGKHDDLINAAARAVHMAGLWLDQNAPAEIEVTNSAWEQGEQSTPEDEEAAEFAARPDGSVLKGEPALDAPPRGSMAERLERSRGNAYAYEGMGRWRNN